MSLQSTYFFLRTAEFTHFFDRGISKLNLNLFKNAFNYYEEYLEMTNKIASFATE